MSVQNEEHLARFIVNEGWINNGNGAVKGDAFRPRKEWGQLKTSVTRHNGNSFEEIKNKGKDFEKVKRKNPICVFGWANVITGAVRTISVIPALDVEADEDNKRDSSHANIVGWDNDDGKQMLQAEEVARQSTPVLLS